MIRRILLHIGSPKCGSTFLQQVLLQNAATLEKHGVRYPHDGGGHPGNAANLADIDTIQLGRWFAEGIQTVILSHEDLYSLCKRGDTLARLAREGGIAVHLICFLRPFSEFVYGDYSQFMKQFFDTFLSEREAYGGRDFATFAQRRIDTMKPASYLRQWQLRFAQVPLTVASHRRIRPVMTELLGASVADGLNWTVGPSQVNRSLRMEDCDAIAAAMRDRQVPDEDIKCMFREAFHKVGEPDAGKTPERTAWLEAQFAPQNQALLEEFAFDNRREG